MSFPPYQYNPRPAKYPNQFQNNARGVEGSGKLFTVFVGGLSYFCNEAFLSKLFLQFEGVVLVSIDIVKKQNAKYIEDNRILYAKVEYYQNFHHGVTMDGHFMRHHLHGKMFMGRMVAIGFSNDEVMENMIRSTVIPVQYSFLTTMDEPVINEEYLFYTFSNIVYPTKILDVSIKRYQHHLTHKGRQSGYGFLYVESFDEEEFVIKRLKDVILDNVEYDCVMSKKSMELRSQMSRQGSGGSINGGSMHNMSNNMFSSTSSLSGGLDYMDSNQPYSNSKSNGVLSSNPPSRYGNNYGLSNGGYNNNTMGRRPAPSYPYDQQSQANIFNDFSSHTDKILPSYDDTQSLFRPSTNDSVGLLSSGNRTSSPSLRFLNGDPFVTESTANQFGEASFQRDSYIGLNSDPVFDNGSLSATTTSNSSYYTTNKLLANKHNHHDINLLGRGMSSLLLDEKDPIIEGAGSIGSGAGVGSIGFSKLSPGQQSISTTNNLLDSLTFSGLDHHHHNGDEGLLNLKSLLDSHDTNHVDNNKQETVVLNTNLEEEEEVREDLEFEHKIPTSVDIDSIIDNTTAEVEERETIAVSEEK